MQVYVHKYTTKKHVEFFPLIASSRLLRFHEHHRVLILPFAD